MQTTRICHLTSVHQRYDIRVFMKECSSLASNAYEVFLIVADGKGNEQKNGVQIIDVGAPMGRIDRMFHITSKIYETAIQLDCDLYHFHDPELILTGLHLKRKGKTVIFDAHEDVTLQLLSKPYLNLFSRRLFSVLFGIFESFTCRKFDGIVTATPFIRVKFLKMNKLVQDINNYPFPDELNTDQISEKEKKLQVCFIGGLTVIRGIKELVSAMESVNSNVKLVIGGEFSEKEFSEKIKLSSGWKKVSDLGFINRSEVRDVMQESIAGMVTFLPVPNHINAQPNKMFEYMSAGIPVIGSDFPLWREIIVDNHCGICVNPEDPSSIANAIDYLVAHPDEAKQMGINGKEAVKNKYHWGSEEKKLLGLYSRLLQRN
jgi:glycosyltransferase involved in cell wall biosynthesis